MEHRDGRVVAERHVVEADLAPDRRQLQRVGRLQDRGFGLEQVLELEDRSPTLLEGVVLLHQQLNGREEAVHVEEEGGQLTQVDLLGVVEVHGPADRKDQDLAEHTDQL